MTKASQKEIQRVDFDLRQLEIFRKVVELGSFSKAAKAVYLAQASVSERIATLESMVSAKLLDRLGRQVVPTKAGELLYKHAVLLLEMKDTACLEMKAFLGASQGEVHVGGSTIPGEYILPKVLGKFKKERPMVTINLTVGDTREIERAVLEGALELGVIGSRSFHKAIIANDLWKDELVLGIPATHRWAGMEEIELGDLTGEPFIFREPGSGTFQILEKYLKDAGLGGLDELTRAATFGTSTAVKEGIKAGLGISIISSRALETELAGRTVSILRIKGIPMFRSFYLIRDKRRISSPLCRAFIDFLVREYGA